MHYTQSHEWITVQGGIGTVGITEYAKNELGDIVYIELPKVGSLVKAGQEVCVLESTKAAVDVYSPTSGEIVEVNVDLAKNPAILKDQDTWLFKIELTDLKELEQLLSNIEYAKLHK